MRVVIDIEANSLTSPTHIWVIVCKDVDSDMLYIFRKVTQDAEERARFQAFAKNVRLWIGHNILGYDFIWLCSLGILPGNPESYVSVCFDTLIASKLVLYNRDTGHSIEAWGEKLGYPKLKFSDWSKYTQEMEDYCVRDTEICALIFLQLSSIPWLYNTDCVSPCLDLEQRFQLVCIDMSNTGFAFNRDGCERLLKRVEKELKGLDQEIEKTFLPKEVLIREFTPKLTKFGTISRTSVPRSLHQNIHQYQAGETYRHTRLIPFNPSSHKQLIDVLTEARWNPINKTDTHKDTERAFRRIKTIDLKKKLEVLSKYGWKIDEDNLSTLPPTAPSPARSLAKRILLESRRRTLTEWLSLVSADGRIHGRFYGIGAWTHRMSHQAPNTANIPRAFKEDGSIKLLGKELRSLWIAPKKKLLVGVDAEGIQLRIFAHYIDDKEFTDALVNGKKADKSDPHSLNQRVLGSICKTRQAAKRFVYALLLGGGLGKLAEILGCSKPEAKEALDRLLRRYRGFERMRKTVFPRDAKRGWFEGLDGRKVPLPGETQRDREHLAMSGYLQNGETIIIKRAALTARDQIRADENLSSWAFVDIIHDDLLSECKNDLRIAKRVAQIKADAIKAAGEYYNLKCPLAGSFYNEEIKDYTIGTNWLQAH